MRFKVEYISQPAPSPYVIVRRVESGGFKLGAKPTLGDIPITTGINQPRSMNPDGTPDLSVFAFQLRSPKDLARLEVGQVVELKG
jgi:hypothetical protein